MNLNLNHEGFESYVVEKREALFGVQYLFRFENDYGASVVKHVGSYGCLQDLWELAVIVFDEETDEWDLAYSTEITSNVEGYLTDSDVRNLLKRIKEL